MSKIVLSRPIFEVLVKHLVDIEEEKDRIMGEFYPNITEERDKFQQLINTYIKEIEDYLSNSKVQEKVNTDYPFVTIGSIVEIEDMNYKEAEKIKDSVPFYQ